MEFVKEVFDTNTTDRKVLEFNDTGAVPIELFAETQGTMSEERRNSKCNVRTTDNDCAAILLYYGCISMPFIGFKFKGIYK